MIISGQTALKRAMLTNLRDGNLQTQPCGIDVTLKAVFKWTGAGTLDFSNSLRKPASVAKETYKIASSGDNYETPVESLHLSQGAYLVEFNELLDMPLDTMGHVYARSSLYRSGGLIHGGVMDAGYKGAFGALLQVSILLGTIVSTTCTLC